MNPLLALAYAACVLGEVRGSGPEARGQPAVPSASGGSPQCHLECLCGAEEREGGFSPGRGAVCRAPFFLPQSQWLSHLDHFLDYVAQEVRKGGERKTNKMKLFSMHSLSGGRTDVRGPRSGCITQGKANARGLILRRKIRGTFMPPNGH